MIQCEKCGGTKFKTIKKYWDYQCRKCGHVFFNMNAYVLDPDAPPPVRVEDFKQGDVSEISHVPAEVTDPLIVTYGVDIGKGNDKSAIYDSWAAHVHILDGNVS